LGRTPGTLFHVQLALSAILMEKKFSKVLKSLRIEGKQNLRIECGLALNHCIDFLQFSFRVLVFFLDNITKLGKWFFVKYDGHRIISFNAGLRNPRVFVFEIKNSRFRCIFNSVPAARCNYATWSHTIASLYYD